MTNEELKKKIVDTMHPILKGTRVSCNEENACEHCLFPCEVDRIADRLADALIVAGYGDVKEAKKEVEYWKSEVKTARADIDDAVKEITKHIFTELRDCFAEQSAYAVDCNQHTGYYDYEIKASDVVCDIVSIAEKYGVELGAKDND